jgi:hypothetical protein
MDYFRELGLFLLSKAPNHQLVIQIDLGEQDVTVTITVRWALN